MLKAVKNPHTISAHANSGLLISLAARVRPVARSQEPPILVHSAWAGWHYQIPADDETGGGTEPQW